MLCPTVIFCIFAVLHLSEWSFTKKKRRLAALMADMLLKNENFVCSVSFIFSGYFVMISMILHFNLLVLYVYTTNSIVHQHITSPQLISMFALFSKTVPCF